MFHLIPLLSGQLVVLDGVLVAVAIHRVDVVVVSIKANYVPRIAKIVTKSDWSSSLILYADSILLNKIDINLFSKFFTVIFKKKPFLVWNKLISFLLFL